jgi:hypothetical protein
MFEPERQEEHTMAAIRPTADVTNTTTALNTLRPRQIGDDRGTKTTRRWQVRRTVK